MKRIAFLISLLSVASLHVFSQQEISLSEVEYNIRLSDSLYKNYLPQYNYEEVKASVEFFELGVVGEESAWMRNKICLYI